MKRLVLLGEGQGETAALPILARKILRERDAAKLFFVDEEVFRARNPVGLVKWDAALQKPDFSAWHDCLRRAVRRSNLGGILAVFDGDARNFPAGTSQIFCASTAAKLMAAAASEVGAGKTFSLAVVFACVEYETWIIAGIESLTGKLLSDGRAALPAGLKFPEGPPESHAKKWLETNCPGYRPTRDQAPLTELLDLDVVRHEGLRSFRRLEDAIAELLRAVERDAFASTPS